MEEYLMDAPPIRIDRATRRKIIRQSQKRARKAGLHTDLPAAVGSQPAPPEDPVVSEHQRRNSARIAGLLVPPTAAERSGLRQNGHDLPEPTIRPSGIWVPPT